MPGNDPLPPPPPPVAAEDPRLRQFQASAAQIVAVERGLTPLCRAKLAAVASKLGLCDAEFQEALVRLQASASEPAAPPLAVTWNSQNFRKYLNKKLRGLPVPLLTPDQEDRLVAIAAKRYSLPEKTARQLVAEVTAERNVRRIERSFAEQNVNQLISQILDDALQISQTDWERVYVAARPWGLADEQVRALVDEHLARARELRVLEHRWYTILICACGFALVFLLTIGIGVYLRRHDNARELNTAATPSLTTESVVPKARRPSQPDWWNVDLALAVAETRRKHEGFVPLQKQLASELPATRAIGYEKLVDWARNHITNADDRKTLATMLNAIHALEPDDAAAARLRDRLVGLALIARRELPKGESDYQSAFWAIDVAVNGLKHSAVSEERTNSLAALLERTLEIHIDRDQPLEQLQKRCFAALSELIYRQITSSATAQPQLAFELQRGVAKFAAQCLRAEELERLDVTFLVAALPAVGESWPEYREFIESCVASKDPLNVLKMVELYERLSLLGLQRYLGDLLVLRVGVKIASQDVAAVARAVRQALGATAAPTVADSKIEMPQVERLAKTFLAQPRATAADIPRLLKETIQAANLANAAFAVLPSNHFPEIVEKVLANPDAEFPVEKSVPTARGDRPRGERSATSAAVVEQRRRNLEQQMTILSNFEQQHPVKRFVAFRTLMNMRPETGELPPGQGVIVAKYLLAAKTSHENQQLVEAAPQICRDTYVRLGLADELAAATLKKEDLAKLMTAVIGRPIRDEELSTLRSGLRRELLQDVLKELPELESNSPSSDPSAALDAAQEALGEIYRTRGQIWGIEGRGSAEDTDISGILTHRVKQMAASQNKARLSASEAKYIADLPFELTAIEYVGGNDLRRTVLLQRVLVRLLAIAANQNSGSRSADVSSILESLTKSDMASRHLLEQLRDGELAILRIGLLSLPNSGGKK